MSVQTVEKILTDLSDNDEFRAKMFADPIAELGKHDLSAEERDLLYRMVYAIRAKSSESQEYIRVNFIDKLLTDRAPHYVMNRIGKPSVRCIGDGASMKYYVA